MANIDGWLARKYQIQQEQADTQQQIGLANAEAIRTQTGLAPAEAAARNYAARGAGAGSFAQANLTGVNAALAPGLAGSENASRFAAAGLAGVQANSIGSADAINDFLGQSWFKAQQERPPGGTETSNPPANGGYNGGGNAGGTLVPNGQGGFTNGPGASNQGAFTRGGGGTLTGPFQGSGNTISTSGGNEGGYQGQVGGTRNNRTGVDLGPRGYGYSEGTTRVNAPGDGTVDTQQATLADGEAVLNKGAAEHLGRSTIELLNAIGAVKMGLTVGDARGDGAKGDKSPSRVQAQEGGTPGYAWGTPNVGGPPGPGQTQSSGSWDPAEAAAQAMAGGTPPPPVQVAPPAAGPVFGKRKTPPVAGYAKGTAKVSVKGKGGSAPPAADQSGGLTPQIIQAIMGMTGGMGGKGMPPAQGMQPMPMSMPSTGGRS